MRIAFTEIAYAGQSGQLYVDYRRHFQPAITKLQRMLDQAQYEQDWGAYLRLRHKMIEIKEHIVAHEAKCGYNCDCELDPEWARLCLDGEEQKSFYRRRP